MFKNFFYISCFFLIANCSVPGTAFLGPAFTGAKTGSIYQASLSYGTGKVMDQFKESSFFLKSDQFLSKEYSTDKDPIILISYMVDKVEISEVLEPEPLP